MFGASLSLTQVLHSVEYTAPCPIGAGSKYGCQMRSTLPLNSKPTVFFFFFFLNKVHCGSVT